MTDNVFIEPAHERRPHFALWCLAQTPVIQTASSTGFDVPLDLYPTVPADLLEGAYVDGYRYGLHSTLVGTLKAAEVPSEPIEVPAAPPEGGTVLPRRRSRKEGGE